MTSPAPSPRRRRRAHDEAPAHSGALSSPAHDEAAVLSDAHPAHEGTHAPRSVDDVRVITFGAVAWLVILAAVAGVQLGRHAWPDAIVLLVVLGVLVLDLSGRLPHGSIAVARTGPAIIGTAVLVGLALFVGPRHGTIAGLAVVAAGAAVAYAWPDRAEDERVTDDRPVWDRRTSRTALAWAAAWIAACLWELTMFILGSFETDGRDRYPAASDLLDPALAHPVGKILFVVVWLTAGVALLSRADRR